MHRYLSIYIRFWGIFHFQRLLQPNQWCVLRCWPDKNIPIFSIERRGVRSLRKGRELLLHRRRVKLIRRSVYRFLTKQRQIFFSKRFQVPKYIKPIRERLRHQQQLEPNRLYALLYMTMPMQRLL